MREYIKVFNGVPENCEEDVSEWLRENAGKIKIIRVLQSSASFGSSGQISSTLHITIFFFKVKKKK